MPVLVYANDADSVYDFFFLNHFLKSNKVYLLTFNQKPTSVPEGVSVVRIPEPFHPKGSPWEGVNIYIGSLVRSFFLRHRLSQIKPDVFISGGGLLYGFYSALSNSTPFVLFIWGSEVLVAPKFPPFRLMVKYSLKKAEAVVVDSDVQERACIGLGCDPKKITKFPWVDSLPIINRANSNDDKKCADILREKIGWRESGPIIISTRWHRPVYNVECLIRAIPQVIKEVPTAHFLILGNGTLTESLQKTAVSMGVSANVKFIGKVPFEEMSKYLKLADIYVSTSLSDGSSASLLEAMACSLPVIVTDTAGNREWITNGETGLLFPPKDSEALAERIVRLSKDENLRSALAKKALQTVSKKADWTKNSKLLDDTISYMISLKI